MIGIWSGTLFTQQFVCKDAAKIGEMKEKVGE